MHPTVLSHSFASSMFVSVFFCFIAALGTVNGKFQPICEPPSASNASSPKLPNLPTAFSTLLEVNIVKKNYTAVYREVYDQKADKGRLERTRNGAKHVDIYDYTLDEVIHIDDKNCSVSSTLDTGHCQFSFFGVGSHIESVSQLFKFGKQFNEKYMGVTSVRGIRCHHWRTCISTNYSSYNLDYYFSVPKWETTWGMLNSTVVRAVVNGTSVNAKMNCTSDRFTLLNDTHDFYNVYDFFNFRPGPQDPASFQLPEGVYCKGLKGANKTAPKLPSSVFSMEFEFTISGYNILSSWQEIYDVEKKLALFKHPDWWNPKVGPIILIHDFNTGIGYNISSHHPGTTCHLFNITLKNWDATDDGSHHIRMKTVQELGEGFTRTNGSSALVYKGTATVRGMGADIWVGKTNMKIKNVTYQIVHEWYFAKPNWKVESLGFQGVQHQVLLRFDSFTKRGHNIMSVFNFNPDAGEPTLFDIKPCFTREEQRVVWFSLHDPEGKYGKYVGSKELRLSLAKAVSAAANVTIIRVNGIRVVDYKKEELVVTFTLLDRPKAVGGNVAVVYPEKGLMDALDALNNSVNNAKLKVQFQGDTLQAIKSSFVVGFSPGVTPPPIPVTPSSRPQPGGGGKQKKGVSSGVAAGISIVMLVVGIAGGLLIAHVIMKRRGTGLFSYQTQE